MTISIYSTNSEYIRINLLEIASNILKNYKVWEIYSIDLKIDFDLLFITDWGDIRSHYYISSSGIINEGRYEYELTSETDSAWVTSEEYIKSESRGYSDQEFMNIINIRLKRWLEKIGLKRIESFINGNSIVTTCETNYSTKDDYTDFLCSYTEHEINALHPIISIEGMRKWVLNTLRRLSEQYESNTLIITSKDLTLSSNSKGNLRNDSEYDIIRIFEYYIPDNLLELMIYLLVYEWEIQLMSKSNTDAYKVILSERSSVTKEKVIGPIHFDKSNGVITLNGIEVGTLDKWTRYYDFFEVIYDNSNTLLNASFICEQMKVGKITSAEYNYVRWVMRDLVKHNKLNKAFVEEFIEARNSHFILKNK